MRPASIIAVSMSCRHFEWSGCARIHAVLRPRIWGSIVANPLEDDRWLLEGYVSGLVMDRFKQPTGTLRPDVAWQSTRSSLIFSYRGRLYYHMFYLCVRCCKSGGKRSGSLGRYVKRCGLCWQFPLPRLSSSKKFGRYVSCMGVYRRPKESGALETRTLS